MTGRLLLTCVGIVCAFSLSAQKKFSRLKVNEIGTNSPDTFCIQAFVKEVYQCPPCPPGAQCKPCIGDHIRVTDADQKNSLRLFTENPKKFIVHQEYLFTVWLRNRSHPIDFLLLVASEEKGKKMRQ